MPSITFVSCLPHPSYEIKGSQFVQFFQFFLLLPMIYLIKNHKFTAYSNKQIFISIYYYIFLFSVFIHENLHTTLNHNDLHNDKIILIFILILLYFFIHFSFLLHFLLNIECMRTNINF